MRGGRVRKIILLVDGASIFTAYVGMAMMCGYVSFCGCGFSFNP